MTSWEPPRGYRPAPETEEHWAAYWATRGPYARAIEYLRVGKADYLDDALFLLQRRPIHHGSGYDTERTLQVIDRAPLTKRQTLSVVDAATAIAGEGYRREVWPAMRLLVRLGVPGWVEELRDRGERAERWGTDRLEKRWSDRSSD